MPTIARMTMRPWLRLREKRTCAPHMRAERSVAGQRAIALSESEATRFLEALARPDEGTVARLKRLRRGA